MVIDTPGGMPQPAQPASAGLGAAEGSNIPVQVHDEEQARVAQLRSAQLKKSLDEESDADEDARAVTARAGGHGVGGAVARANSEDGVARQLDLGSAETAPPSASQAWPKRRPPWRRRAHAPADDSPGMQAALGGLNSRYRESKKKVAPPMHCRRAHRHCQRRLTALGALPRGEVQQVASRAHTHLRAVCGWRAARARTSHFGLIRLRRRRRQRRRCVQSAETISSRRRSGRAHRARAPHVLAQGGQNALPHAAGAYAGGSADSRRCYGNPR